MYMEHFLPNQTPLKVKYIIINYDPTKLSFHQIDGPFSLIFVIFPLTLKIFFFP